MIRYACITLVRELVVERTIGCTVPSEQCGQFLVDIIEDLS